MTLISDALSSGFSAIEDTAGEPIIIRRGNIEDESFGVLGQSVSENNDGGGQTVIESRTTDCLIRKDRYLHDAQPARPYFGDIIQTGDGRRFQVQADGGSPVWRWSDPYQTHYRIHTVELNRAT